MAENPEKTPFYNIVRSTYGSYIGAGIADAAERNLRKWSIDPASLRKLEESGHNAMVFTDGQLAIKIKTELERFGQMPPPRNPVTLEPLAYATIGYDQGQAAIAVEAYPLLDTKNVTVKHVKALCHELYTKHGLLFRDNKPRNVGLTQQGLPYVIDDGSLIRIGELAKLENPYMYPENSGMRAAGLWEEPAQNHGFSWPENQRDIPEIEAAAARLAQRPAPSHAKG